MITCCVQLRMPSAIIVLAKTNDNNHIHIVEEVFAKRIKGFCKIQFIRSVGKCSFDEFVHTQSSSNEATTI